METLLSGSKLTEEVEFFKRQIDIVAALKIKYAANYVPPLDHRPKRATLANIPVCEPPAAQEQSDEPAGLETIALSIKSIKPTLVFSLSCPSTSTISSLKSLLASQESSAPSAELQRWILKGKSMGDDKLLREFGVKNGDVVNLMISKAAPATASASTTSDEPVVPPLTLTEPTSALSKPLESVVLPVGAAQSHSDKVIASPAFWIDVLALLRRQFGNTVEGERNAVSTWETWLTGSLPRISPSEKAMIRQQTGLLAM